MEICLNPENDSNQTKRVNSAIQDLKSKGGILRFTSGMYRLGTVVLESNLQIVFEPGVEIYYSDNEDDFLEGEEPPFDTFADRETSIFRFALFYGEEIENVSIIGPAKFINEHYPRDGPKPFAIKSGMNLTLKNFIIERAPNYNISLIDCENVVISGIKIFNALCDGIDLDGCRMVQIINCVVDSWDDGICLKSSMALGRKLFSRNIMITNCSVSSSCNCFKIGTETHGDFQDITLANCTFPPRGLQRQAESAIAIESTDGSNIQGLAINNCVSRMHKCLIFIQLGKRLRASTIGQSQIGSIRDILISNIIGESVVWPLIISGLPEKPIENVKIGNLILNYRKDNFKFRSLREIEEAAIKENIDAKYPHPEMFGGFPASIIYLRNIRNLTIKDMFVKRNEMNDTHKIMDIAIQGCKNIRLTGEFDCPKITTEIMNSSLIEIAQQ